MRAQPVNYIGPHGYKIAVGGYAQEPRIYLMYCLYLKHGYRGAPLPGRPNSHGWKTSRKDWPNTREGHDEARVWAQWLLRYAKPRTTSKELPLQEDEGWAAYQRYITGKDKE